MYKFADFEESMGINMSFNHFDEAGNAIMVDVTKKQETERVAVAEGTIYVNEEV